MTNEKDHVADIMKKWYDAMEKNKVMVQPKASTLLGTILAGYSIEPTTTPRDIWKEVQGLRGGEFLGWYEALSKTEQEEYHHKLETVRVTNADPVDKQLLKG